MNIVRDKNSLISCRVPMLHGFSIALCEAIGEMTRTNGHVVQFDFCVSNVKLLKMLLVTTGKFIEAVFDAIKIQII